MYKPDQATIDSMPSLGWDDVKHTGHNSPGEPCKCNQCGKPARNRLGLRVHIHQAHINVGSKKGPRGPYKRNGLDRSQTNQPTSSVSFCPGCGCNIKAVTMAMKLTQ